MYIRNLEYMNVSRCYPCLHLGLKVFFLLVLRFECYMTCGSAGMTFGLFPFYSANVVKLHFILMLLCAMPVLT